ncbi:MAG: ATP-binding cassette domain-containing protein [Succiniclasticum sp.]|nr:ATP-binding cassette domain-containing protein [Succiniclasticum sp.]
MLEVKNLSFSYNKDTPILKDFSMTMEAGERVALLGPSGCGKSTFSQILAGFIRPDAGTVLLDGKPLPKDVYSPIQLIYQHPEKAMNPRWKLRQILDEAWQVPQRLLAAMGVEERWLSRWPNELSGGQLQRLSILRALNPATRLLIADEITASLDPITQVQIWSVILEECKNNNTAILAITHNRLLAKKICSRAIDFSKESHLCPDV